MQIASWKWQVVVSAVFGIGMAFAAPVRADVWLPGLFGDGMILQRDLPVPVWGTAGPGQQVTVNMHGQQKGTVAGADGRWILRLDPLSAGGPYEMTVVTGDDATAFTDVLVGDVWLCTGQSNMAFATRGAVNAQQELQQADLLGMRLFKVEVTPNHEPAEDVSGQWQRCDAQSASAFSAVGFFFGRRLHRELDVPIGLIQATRGATSIQTWMSREALGSVPGQERLLNRLDELLPQREALMRRYEREMEEYREALERMRREGGERPQFIHHPFSGPTGHFNGMIAPLAPYGIRGCIWYQGEGNVNDCQNYPALFDAMVSDWRERWAQGDFPFLFVQISSYKGWTEQQQTPEPDPNEQWWGFAREAQERCLEVPRTAMAVSLDHGEFGDAHPKNKQIVADRLARAALAMAYGRDVVYRGPTYAGMTVEGVRVRLRFHHAHGGLVLKPDPGKSGFAIAGVDRRFHWAQAKVDGDTVVVWSPLVAEPVAVRYAWANFPYFSLYNGAGLPAGSFRTDDWPRLKQSEFPD